VCGFLGKFFREQGKISQTCSRRSRSFNAVIGKICQKDMYNIL
jgi:hypothetical protein